MSNHFEITLNGVTEDLEMKQRPPSLVDFLDSIKSGLFVSTSTRFSRINSFEYLHRNEDYPDYMELVSDSTDYDVFLEYLNEDDGTIIVELIVDPEAPQQYEEAGSESHQREEGSDETKDLMEKVKKALEEDHSLAEKLKEIVHEVCGPHPPQHDRGHGERGRGRGRGTGSQGGRGRPPFEHGPFPPPRHRHDHRSDDEEGPHPPFPPFDHPASPPYHGPFPHFHPSSHHAFPPPPHSSWNVDRVIYETWTPSFPSPPSHFGHPPPPHHHQHHHHEPFHHRPERGRFPRHYPGSQPPFEREIPSHEFPPFGPPPHAHFHHSPQPPLERIPSHGDHHRAIPGEFPGREHSQACCPPPPAPSDHHRAHEASGAEDWEVEFEELSVR